MMNYSTKLRLDFSLFFFSFDHSFRNPFFQALKKPKISSYLGWILLFLIQKAVCLKNRQTIVLSRF